MKSVPNFKKQFPEAYFYHLNVFYHIFFRLKRVYTGNLYSNLILSAIKATNSEFVGFPFP